MRTFFLLVLILAYNLFAQEWNEIKTTEIAEPEKYDIFANSSGIHTLARTGTGVITYYKLNSEGDVQTTSELEPFNGGDFPNIIGTNDKIYAIYKAGNNIRVKYSTDNGNNWIWNSDLDRPTTANYCNGVDAVFQDGPSGGVHIVWATQDGGTSGFETYYRRLAPDNSWPEYKTVTDHSLAQYGGNPSVTVSPNRVHVSFNTDATTSIVGSGEVKSRDKFNGIWQTPQTVVSSSELSVDERLLVRGDYLYLFYNCPNSYDLKYKTRPLATTSWSGYPPIEAELFWFYEDAFEVTKTTNNFIHIIYKKNIDGTGWVFTYKYYDGISWSNEDNFDDNANVLPIGLSSTSNDFFLIWVKTGTPYLRFRQYDAIPLAPQNTSLSSNSGNFGQIRVSWVKNSEADLSLYEIWRKVDIQGNTYELVGTTTNNYFVDPIYLYCPGGGDFYVTYKVRAKDMGNKFSPYSNEAGIRAEQLGKKFFTCNSPADYNLDQNYPNPFNPNTKISYSIKEEGLVTLKVYDILGKEIATLVNENKPSGNYEAEFNASQLPSGMYIYKIQAGKFSDVKKMLLTK
ncbi:MAG: T9SS type A sorting domain-containing protein [Ignavibacteriota bacterium]